MKKLEIKELGDPILRLKAKNIKKTDLKKPTFKGLIRDMFLAMDREDGVGLAAPQIGKSIRLFVAGIPDEDGHIQKSIFINPRIAKKSKVTVPSWEGCLSVPGLRGLVGRHKQISVSYWDEKGRQLKRNLVDFDAVVFQHEFDHLEGILYLDRLVSTKSLFTTKEFDKRLS